MTSAELTSIGRLNVEQIRSSVQQQQNAAVSIGQLLGQGEVAGWLGAAPRELGA